MEKKRSAEQILRDRYKKQNDYNREKYERITVLAPPGTVERIKALGVKSVSKFALQLLTAEITRRERSEDQETSAETSKDQKPEQEPAADQEPKTETTEPTPAPKQETAENETEKSEEKPPITWDVLAEMQKSGNFDFSKYQ